jgi:uracil-DNA glycosylase
MPEVRLTVLVGNYATRRYLHLSSKDRLTDVVRGYKTYLPEYFPLVHPSPRNQIWLRKNPWFEEDVLPDLRGRIADALR